MLEARLGQPDFGTLRIRPRVLCATSGSRSSSRSLARLRSLARSLSLSLSLSLSSISLSLSLSLSRSLSLSLAPSLLSSLFSLLSLSLSGSGPRSPGSPGGRGRSSRGRRRAPSCRARPPGRPGRRSLPSLPLSLPLSLSLSPSLPLSEEGSLPLSPSLRGGVSPSLSLSEEGSLSLVNPGVSLLRAGGPLGGWGPKEGEGEGRERGVHGRSACREPAQPRLESKAIRNSFPSGVHPPHARRRARLIQTLIPSSWRAHRTRIGRGGIGGLRETASRWFKAIGGLLQEGG